MTKAFVATTTIDRPISVVWERLTDWAAGPDWMSGVDAMQAAGPTRVGTTVAFTSRGQTRSSTIVALDESKLITLRSQQGGVRADYTYTCRADGPMTVVTLTADVHASGLSRLAAGAIRAAIRKADAGQLEALKRVVENRHVADHP